MSLAPHLTSVKGQVGRKQERNVARWACEVLPAGLLTNQAFREPFATVSRRIARMLRLSLGLSLAVPAAAEAAPKVDHSEAAPRVDHSEAANFVADADASIRAPALSIWASDTSLVNLGFAYGGDVYGTVHASLQPIGDELMWGLGVGLGMRFALPNVDPAMAVHVEAQVQHATEGGEFLHSAALGKLRGLVSYRLSELFGVFGGLTLNFSIGPDNQHLDERCTVTRCGVDERRGGHQRLSLFPALVDLTPDQYVRPQVQLGVGLVAGAIWDL